MKKKLLKPPPGDGEILFLPGLEEFTASITENDIVGVCHQPYFFNPGISLKFLFLKNLDVCRKKFVFMDTDSVKIWANTPFRDGFTRRVNLVSSEKTLHDYPAPEGEIFETFFSRMEEGLSEISPGGREEALPNLARFREIVRGRREKEYLKEILTESFLEFYGIDTDYYFFSDLLKGEGFKDFVARICENAGRFREIYNNAIGDYGNKFRFRYRNYPFPLLNEGELPFWIIENGARRKCYEKDLERSGTRGVNMFPRAATLTIFLRLHELGAFIHGVGGANYEWVQDRIIERFFEKTPPRYAVLSGTFLLKGLRERELPYFLFDPARVRAALDSFQQ